MSRQLRFGPYVLDRATFELRKGDEVRHLETRAFDLLVYLIEHRDRVVSAEELLREVWRGRVVCFASVSVAVALVRSALDDSARTPRYIKTTIGRGYRFAHPLDPEPSEGDI